MAQTFTHEEQAYVDDLTAEFGPSWDDTSDFSTRYADTYTPQPRVERVRKHVAGPHLPDSHWQATSCLCSCHYGQAGTCDEADCRTWRKQNAEKARAQAEHKRARWERKHGLASA